MTLDELRRDLDEIRAQLLDVSAFTEADGFNPYITALIREAADNLRLDALSERGRWWRERLGS